MLLSLKIVWRLGWHVKTMKLLKAMASFSQYTTFHHDYLIILINILSFSLFFLFPVDLIFESNKFNVDYYF